MLSHTGPKTFHTISNTASSNTAEGSDLAEQFETLKEVWDQRELSLTNSSEARFHDWFRVNCLEVVRKVGADFALHTDAFSSDLILSLYNYDR